jgi:hypothetical protein
MQKRRFLFCAWVPNRTFSATLAFPGRYLLAAPHELFPTTVAFFVVVCFLLWLLLSATTLLKLLESQKQVNGIGKLQKYPLLGCTSHQGPPGQLTLCTIWPWHHKPHCGFDVMAKTLHGEKMMQRTSYLRHLLTSLVQSEESASGVLFSSDTTTSLRPSKFLPLD